jgi:hypothetical protein
MAVATQDDLTVLIGQEAGTPEMQQIANTSDRLRMISSSMAEETSYIRRLAVIARATQLDEVAVVVSEANRANRLRALLIDSNVDSDWIPYMIERAKLRVLRNVLVHHGPGIPLRFLWAWARGIESHIIANATAFDDRLVVRNCLLKSFEIGFDTYPALARIAPSARSSFEIDPDGMFLHWSDADVHLTMEDVLLAKNPALRARARAARLQDSRAFGAAVRSLREEHGLTQSRIPGLSPRHVRRIEQGFIPGDEALQRLAAAHRMDPDQYLEVVTELSA